MDNESTSDTIPYNEIINDNISLEHEAKVSKVSEEQLFYLMSRGISEARSNRNDRHGLHRAIHKRTSNGIRS